MKSWVKGSLLRLYSRGKAMWASSIRALATTPSSATNTLCLLTQSWGKKNSTKLMGGLDHPYFYLFIIGEVCYCWCSHLHPNKSLGCFGWCLRMFMKVNKLNELFQAWHSLVGGFKLKKKSQYPEVSSHLPKVVGSHGHLASPCGLDPLLWRTWAPTHHMDLVGILSI